MKRTMLFTVVLIAILAIAGVAFAAVEETPASNVEMEVSNTPAPAEAPGGDLGTAPSKALEDNAEISRRPAWQDLTWWKGLVTVLGFLMAIIGKMIAGALRKIMTDQEAVKFTQIAYDICAWVRAKFPDNDLPKLFMDMVKAVQAQLGCSEDVAKRLVAGFMSKEGLITGDTIVRHR